MSVPFATSISQGRSKQLTAERLINLYAEKAPDQANSPVVIYGTPGLSRFAIVGTGPIRATHEMASVLFVVSGVQLFSVDSSGTPTLLGAIAGTGRVHTADNGTQLVLVNDIGTGFVWDGATLDTITDPDYQLASSCAFLNQYIVFSVKGSGQFFWSGILDAKAYDALDFATAESSPDILVEIISSSGLLWMLGEKTVDVFYNSGSSAVFERVSGAPMEIGATANTVVSLDNSPFWLSNGIFYRANGYAPVRISTHSIENLIRGWTGPRAFRYIDEGHRFYVVSFDQGCVVYDTTTGLWHERETFSVGRWRGCCYSSTYGKHLVGDYLLGLIYEMDLETYMDDTFVLQSRAITPFINDNGKKIDLGSIQVVFEHGVGLTEGSDPQVILDWTDDGVTWSNELWRGLGKIGERLARTKWNRLGSFRSRAFRVTISDPVKRIIIGANL